MPLIFLEILRFAQDEFRVSKLLAYRIALPALGQLEFVKKLNLFQSS